MSAASTPFCRNCGAALVGAYCHECGQPSPSAVRTLREMLTGQTGRILHTLRALILQPGELALEIEEGRDRGSLRPITLLLNLVAFFFLLSAFTGFGPQAIESADPSGSVAKDIAERAQRSGLPSTLFEERLERRFHTAYTALLPVIALTYAAAIALTHWRRKRWVVPVAAGIHYLCFVYLWLAVLFTTLRWLGSPVYGNPTVLALGWTVALVYLTLLCRRLYQDGWAWAVGKSVLVLITGAIVHNLAIVVALYIALLTF